nr:prolyl oligopeptidase family protein [Tanacetum cinerariifolium]
MAVLQAELQVTKEMIQDARHGGGGGDNLSLTLPRFMHLDVPKFSGIDPDSWIFTINEYFTLLNTPVDQWLRVVGFNLEGDVAEWFHWMSRNKLITTWEGFLESVQNRFGPCRDYALKGEEHVMNFPKDEHEGKPMEQSLALCDARIILQKGIPVWQVMVQ